MGQINNMLKFAFVVVCAALASAEPEAKADAKADAALLYGAYGYAGLPYAGYAGYAYGAYPYAYYGKRSAEAEPEADAYYGYYDMPDLMPMDMPHMLMVLMEVTGDKLNATQLRSSKANIKYQ